MQIIKATYNGYNGSLGYLKGREYLLFVNRTKVVGFEDCQVVIERPMGKGLCPYKTKSIFRKIWKVIKQY